MDILAARKKAAERAREQKPKEAPAPARAEAEVPLPKPEEQAAPAAAKESAAPAAPEQAAPAERALPPAIGPAEAVPAAEPAGEQEAPDLEMLSFRLGTEEYAVLVADVKEVLKNRELTPVPNASDLILGVTALRGPILPVLDLRRRLGLPARERDDTSRILVVSLNDEETGVVVDRVTGVVRIPPSAIRPAPETVEHGAEFLKGIARKDDRLYILLDIEKTLAL